MDETAHGPSATLTAGVSVRRVKEADLGRIVALDERVTHLAKPDYWDDIFERYASRRVDQRFFLVAEANDGSAASKLLGYIVGEVRAWEFGSEPCGWVFAFAVEPETRLRGIGERLFEAISNEFRAAGMRTMRTMVPRHNRLHMAFFRSEGMVAGPYIQLEMELDR
jgi:ribosomal protein S18 acetylase RimI-like enzyme